MMSLLIDVIRARSNTIHSSCYASLTENYHHTILKWKGIDWSSNEAV